MKQRLPLPFAAEEITGRAVALNLPKVSTHRLPAF
jgi:hypothetical protein